MIDIFECRLELSLFKSTDDVRMIKYDEPRVER
jgi:hypothetical protein